MKLGEAHDHLAKLPQVEHVEIQRGLPNNISIDIEERHPVAWISTGSVNDAVTGSEGLLVDAQGTVMKAGRIMPEYLRLPLLCGVNTANLADGQTVDLPELHAALDLLQLNGDNTRLQIRSVDLLERLLPDGRRQRAGDLHFWHRSHQRPARPAQSRLRLRRLQQAAVADREPACAAQCAGDLPAAAGRCGGCRRRHEQKERHDAKILLLRS
ncbi:MAG: FtsQ-type POTRA domain-containing protein [Chthoniobacteraceae bacterium]